MSVVAGLYDEYRKLERLVEEAIEKREKEALISLYNAIDKLIADIDKIRNQLEALLDRIDVFLLEEGNEDA